MLDAGVVKRLPAGTHATVRGTWKTWLRISADTVRGWIPADQFREGTSDGAASEGASPTDAKSDDAPAAKASRSRAAGADRDESALMYSALKEWHGDTPESPLIDRAVAQSKRDADRHKRATRQRAAALDWKDPFADEPDKVSAPVRRRRGGTDANISANDPSPRQEMARARAEAASARAEAAVAKAEAARAKVDAARAEAHAARIEALAARRECVDARIASTTVGEKEPRHVGERAARSPVRASLTERLSPATPRRSSARRLVASASRATDKGRDAGVAPESAESAPSPAVPPEAVPPAVLGDSRGIIVVPITPAGVAPKRSPRGK